MSKRKLQTLNIDYLGIKDPKTPAEIEFEILGLKSVIAEANKKIALLNQAVSLAQLQMEGTGNDNYTGKKTT